MAIRYLINAVVGPLNKRPPPNTPSGGASESAFGLFIDTDTGDIHESTGQDWVIIGTLAGNGATSISGLASDNAEGIAVTGNVDAASFTVGGKRLDLLSLTTVTADYTVQATDHTILVAASGKTITLPDPASVPADTEFRIGNTAAGDTTTVATAAGTILGAATYTKLAAANAAAVFVGDGVSNFGIF